VSAGRKTPGSTSVPRVFLDTNVVSAIARGDHPAYTSAISSLLEAASSGSISLIFSSRVREELNQIPQPHRDNHLAVLAQLTEFPKSSVTWLEPPGENSSVRTDPRYAALLPMLSGVTDPALIVDALDAAAGYWVTVDQRTVRSHRTAIEAVVQIRVVDPPECVQEVLASKTSAVSL
jgi:predicted nucleic acid-binding protein